MKINWKCPHCRATNTDYTEVTAVPMCGDCLLDVEWEDIPERPQRRTDREAGKPSLPESPDGDPVAGFIGREIAVERVEIYPETTGDNDHMVYVHFTNPRHAWLCTVPADLNINLYFNRAVWIDLATMTVIDGIAE